ncbi:MAG: radical SAM protein [Planctomycetota bacterium]|nr:radical SAM protein [Planctomycetota bacterium]
MANRSPQEFDSSWILNARGPKNQVKPGQPYLALLEKELGNSGEIQTTGTIFLTNRECPFRCLMCDLWKNTTEDSVSPRELLQQINFGLEQFQSECRHLNLNSVVQQLKLYNSGNFFDRRAIPRQTLPEIAKRINSQFAGLKKSNLVIENHPKLTGASCLDFAQQIDCELEIAMGLETVHPEILPRLNKEMTLSDFCRATELLIHNSIQVRAFILLRTPFMSETEGIEWALKSIEYAYSIGVNCCSIIPTRRGNGAIDQLEKIGLFSEPSLTSLETVMETGLNCTLPGQRLFVDLWDLRRFSKCSDCFQERFSRLERINFSQTNEPRVRCERCDS